MYLSNVSFIAFGSVCVSDGEYNNCGAILSARIDIGNHHDIECQFIETKKKIFAEYLDRKFDWSQVF